MTNKYRVQVVVSYFHDIEVEAVSEDFAEVLAIDLFDVTKAYPGDCEIRWTTRLDEGGQTS
jgi:hypothetical protein